MVYKFYKRSKLKVFLFILLLLFYLPSLVLWFYSDKIQTGLLYNGEIKKILNVDLLIFKDEKVRIASSDGVLYKSAEEGEKYPKGEEIGYILDEANSELVKDIQDLENRILKKQYEAIKNKNSNSTRLLPNIYKEQNIVMSMSKYYDNTESLSNIDNYIIDLNENITEKINTLNILVPPNASQKELYNEKEKLKNNLINKSEKYVIGETGFISYSYDGYEEILGKKKIYDISVNEFEKILKEYSGFKEIGTNITKDSPIYKILDNKSIYYGFIIKEEDSEFFVENKGITINISNDETINGTIKTIYKDIENKKIIVFLESDVFVEDIGKNRVINSELIINSTKGIKVDVKSLVNVDEMKKNGYIFLAEANYARLVKIKINDINKHFAIIKGEDDKYELDLYDTYLINPQNIKDGQQIDD